MKTFLAGFGCWAVGLFSTLAVIPTINAEVPIFGSGYTLLAPTGQGSYKQGIDGIGYEKLSDPWVGQLWTGDGMNHQKQYFENYRAFLVFNVPRYKGIVTRDEIGIPDWAVPDVTVLRTKVIGASIDFGQIQEMWGDDIIPIDVRWSSLPAAALIGGLIDPKVAFDALLNAPKVDTDSNPLNTSFTSATLNDSFTNFLNHTEGGPVVFSFTMPFLDLRTASDVKYFIPDISLNITYDGYAALSPVPEPATYGCFGAAMCGVLAVYRKVKSKPGKRDRVGTRI